MIKKYFDYGFKVFECTSDKRPISDIRYESFLDIEKAEKLQKNAKYLGALIPDDIIVFNIDVDQKKDINGIEIFRQIKEKYFSDYDIINKTFSVRTPSGGIHIFFKVPKKSNIKSGLYADGVSIKTDGYIITSGSPDYKEYNHALGIDNLPDSVLNWVKSIKPKSLISDIDRPIMLKTLRQILKKIEPDTIPDKIKFCYSCFFIAGSSDEVILLVSNWYKNITGNSIDFKKNNSPDGISVISFIDFLKNSNISKHILQKIINHENVAFSIISNELDEQPLPFESPNYDELVKMPCVLSFFETLGHTHACSILENALLEKVIYSEQDDEFYFFGGSRWEVLTDIYSVCYTVLSVVSRLFYQKYYDQERNGVIINDEVYIKLSKLITNSIWKKNVIFELKHRKFIYKKSIEWDSPKIKETITLLDGVIDFSNGEIKTRQGEKNEYRLSYIDLMVDDVLEADEPKRYNQFLRDVFPDDETLLMANQVVSMCISGNAGRRYFHIWTGAGANGKSALDEIIQHTLGKNKAFTYDSKLLLQNQNENGSTAEFDIFRGKYAAFGQEADDNKRFSGAVIKRLTGGDNISVNPKYKQPYNMEATWQLIISVNSLPSFEGTDGGIIDRLCILPFEVKFCETKEEYNKLLSMGESEKYVKMRVDKIKLIDDIMKEKCGILKKMIFDYIDMAKNYESKIKISSLSQNKKRIYIKDNDNYSDFIDEYCQIGKGFTLFNNDLLEAFSNAYGNDKTKINTLTKNILKICEKVGVERSHLINPLTHKKSRCLVGIRLKGDNENNNSEVDF